jgi:hypothetical protein
VDILKLPIEVKPAKRFMQPPNKKPWLDELLAGALGMARKKS